MKDSRMPTTDLPVNNNLPVQGISTVEAFNNIPVVYCSECLSLKIINYSETIGYCDDCGNTVLSSAHIYNWETKYKDKYKKEFLKN